MDSNARALADASAILAPDGVLAQRLSAYEHRPQQIEMATAVGQALATDSHLVVEAGTGIGKTLAYLIPAIRHASHTGKRVVVSTHTVALQEQLLNKDIPLLNAIMPDEVSAVLMKGRQQYLGLRRMHQALRRQRSLFDKPTLLDEMQQIEHWANQTDDGSLADISPAPRAQVWERVRSEHGNCMGHRCPYFQPCHYQTARRRAHHAHIIVVNHALLASDLALRDVGAHLIPEHDYVIIDEAHTFESVAGQHLGASLSSTQLIQFLKSLFDAGSGKGFLASCHAQAAIHDVQATRQTADAFFRTLSQWQQTKGRNNGRLTHPPDVDNTLSPMLSKLHTQLSRLRDRLTDENDLFEISRHMDRCVSYADLLSEILRQDREAHVYWMDTSPTSNHVTLHTQPLCIAQSLHSTLFQTASATILTSATLSPDRDPSFSYFRSRIGLDNATCLRLDSPFDLHRQIDVHIESRLPSPDNQEAFEPLAAQAIVHHCLEATGGTLVLFTSHDMMTRLAQLVQQPLETAGVTLHVQGQRLGRSAMLNALRDQDNVVLFGCESFWHGIDVQGDALSNVIIVRLPFASPTVPLTEARMEVINQRGGNPFQELQLPDAILRFRQGVGRLIRSSQDRGNLVVLDSRIGNKPYGRHFLSSLADDDACA